MQDIYYEIGNDREILAFDTLEDAIEYASAHGVTLISEIGGSWDDYSKCWFCEEWVPVSEMNRENLCNHCENYLISRGEI